MNNKKITYEQLRQQLTSPDVPEKELRRYLTLFREEGGPFDPVLTPDPRTVEVPDELAKAESGMRFGNALSRFRRRLVFESRRNSGSQRPVLVTEGDSWFQFPFLIDDIVDHLMVDHDVCSVGAAGDTARNMVFQEPEYMQALQSNAESVQAFLFSGAGNDVIGQDANGRPVLARMVRRRRGTESAEELIDRTQVRSTMNFLQGAYRKVIGTIRADSRFANLPIVLHGYDYVSPGGGPSDPRPKPIYAGRGAWLGDALREQNIHDPKLQRGIVRILIDELYRMLERVAGDSRQTGVHVVDVRGTLTKHQDWADEIHATDEGFGRVADLFRKVLNEAWSSGSSHRTEAKSRAQIYPQPATGETSAAVAPALTRPPRCLVGGRVETNRTVHDPERFLAAWRSRSSAEGRTLLGEGPRLERQIGADDSLPVQFLRDGVSRAAAVCRIETSGIDHTGLSGAWVGTGFLVAPGILLTNHHVLNSVEVARNATLEFGYEFSESGSLQRGQSFSLQPDRFFLSSPANGGLDYAFVAIDGEPEQLYGMVQMHRGSFTFKEGDRANVIHHPNGDPKRVSLQDNQVLDFHEVMLHYASDTAGGSSGSPVFDNEWRLIALHHAWDDLPTELESPEGSTSRYINEGVKLAAIVVDLESKMRNESHSRPLRRLLGHVTGSDSLTGYFGARGRGRARTESAYERVVSAYAGTEEDVDVAFWNVEWFNRHVSEKVDAVAQIIADINVDVWALSETSPQATQILVEHLQAEYGQTFEWAASEPDASSGKQSTTVLWNPSTVKGERLEWPEEIDAVLRMDSRDVTSTTLEAVDGKIFNRYPGLFRFSALDRSEGAAFDFNLVPLHLKAMAEGAKRRRLASEVLTWAVREMIAHHDADEDWILGGDINAELATGQFDALRRDGFVALSAEDEDDGAMSYLKGPKSLIDSIFLSPNLSQRFGAKDFFLYAVDESTPDYVRDVSDHRPVLVRLSLGQAAHVDPWSPSGPGEGEEAHECMNEVAEELRTNVRATLRGLAERMN